LRRKQWHYQQGELPAGNCRQPVARTAIDGAELARYVEANGHRFRTETVQSRTETDFGEQLATVAELRARAELAEARLADLKAMLDDMRQQRDRWETVATRLSLSAPKPDEQPPATPAPANVAPAPPVSRLRRAWRWMRATGCLAGVGLLLALTTGGAGAQQQRPNDSANYMLPHCKRLSARSELRRPIPDDQQQCDPEDAELAERARISCIQTVARNEPPPIPIACHSKYASIL
jgi:hypothetical protein